MSEPKPQTTPTTIFPAEIPRKNTVWLHYKGYCYAVVGECQLEATNELAVLYRGIGDATVWARSISDWHAAVDHPQGRRFVQTKPVRRKA